MRVPIQLLSRRVRHDMTSARARLRRPAESVDAMQSRQLAAIQRVWADAVEDVPHYAGLVSRGDAPAQVRSWDDVRSIPVLTRSAIQDRPQDFVRKSRPPESYTATAGSTGTPLRIGMDEDERKVMRTVKLAEWQAFGYGASSRLFLVWGHAHLLGSGRQAAVTHARRRIADWFLGYRRADAYRITPAVCDEIAQQLIQFRPIGLIGYAAALDLFARYARRHRSEFRKLRLGFVLITTEAPPRADTATALGDLFGCPVVEEYGGGDFGQLAFKRGSAPFHVYADLNYLECEAEIDAEPGVRPAIVTSLYGRYLPLIRYRIGDGLLGAREYPHGHVGAFERVAGRMTDAVFLDDGLAIHSLSIFHALHNEADVFNVQMRLTDAGIDLLLVTAPGADRNGIETRTIPRLTRVHPRLAGARFVYVDDVETTRAGKRRWCVDQRTVLPQCAE